MDSNQVDSTPKADDKPKPVVFDASSEPFDNSPISTVYYNLRNEVNPRTKKKYDHRIALWAAWESHKTVAVEGDNNPYDLLSAVGLPKTQKAFAELIGVSDRTIRKYRVNHSNLVEMAKHMGVGRILGRYDVNVLHALGQSASTPNFKHHADRKTFLTVQGYLVTQNKQDITTGGDKLTSIDDAKKLVSSAIIESIDTLSEMNEK